MCIEVFFSKMTSTEKPVSVKKCTCDDKFILFVKSKQFEDVLKGAIQNVMGDIIRDILKHQIREDLRTIIEKIMKIESDVKVIKSNISVPVVDSIEIEEEVTSHDNENLASKANDDEKYCSSEVLDMNECEGEGKKTNSLIQ